MNSKQMAALSELSKAFKKCKEAGICFCGMDNNLLAYNKKELMASERRLGCLYDAQNDCGQGYQVNTHETYLDSGGW